MRNNPKRAFGIAKDCWRIQQRYDKRLRVGISPLICGNDRPVIIIAIFNFKGGVGKTTTAMALATCAARDGLDAAVLDAAPQSAAMFWDEEAEEDGQPLPFTVRAANGKSIARMAWELKGKADKWVFIDCPPSGSALDAAQRAADLIIVPTKAGHLDMAITHEAVRRLMRTCSPYAILFTQIKYDSNDHAYARERAIGYGMNCYERAIVGARGCKMPLGLLSRRGCSAMSEPGKRSKPA